ncbi:MAG: DUF2975 domain-containing protein [Bacteroidota bacterium]
MKTSNQVHLIKGTYILILVLAFAYNFSDMQRGFSAGMNGKSPSDSNFFSYAFLISSAIIGINIIIKLYSFINSVQNDKVFNFINIKRISTLGWFCILQSFLLYGFYFSKSDFNQVSTYRAIISINFDFWLLIFGLTLLTIGFVFKKGIELQQEQDLTI